MAIAQTVCLLAESPKEWIDCVISNFDRFLLDHAAAERKASAMAISFVVQYPDKPEIHIPLIRLAREELLHFQQVTEMINQRGLTFERDEKDPYVRELLAGLSTDSNLRLLDRLLVGSVVEARGVERFGLVAQYIQDPELAAFYDRLAKSEATHAELFPNLARNYFEEAQISERLDHWLRLEARAMRNLAIRPTLH